MKLVKDGGFLVTCSCSHFMDPELFAKTIDEAARDSHVRLRQVEFRTQAPDHPILWNSEESYYRLQAECICAAGFFHCGLTVRIHFRRAAGSAWH